MKLPSGHLTYCTNIHPGKNWDDDFEALKLNFPRIRKAVAGDQPMGIGLRLSHTSSLQLAEAEALNTFKAWMRDNEAYVYTMNGFPYGEFHRTVVKADVHAPDWITDERRDYTIRLFHILRQLLPEGMDGGVSTNPLSYRHWFKDGPQLEAAINAGTLNVVEVIKELVRIQQQTGQVLHLDIEPEPDGIMETGREFIDWFKNDLLRIGVPALATEFSLDTDEAEALIKKHLRLCYDVCHFAIGYEPHETVLLELEQEQIQVGKIQISAALKARLDRPAEERARLKTAFDLFNEPVYLHQVVARRPDGSLIRYTDLPEALAAFDQTDATEWRAHYHVPISMKEIGLLGTTQEDILKVLQLQREKPFTRHLEVETYTWEVMPDQIRLPIAESISQELNWVTGILK